VGRHQTGLHLEGHGGLAQASGTAWAITACVWQRTRLKEAARAEFMSEEFKKKHKKQQQNRTEDAWGKKETRAEFTSEQFKEAFKKQKMYWKNESEFARGRDKKTQKNKNRR
jgi:hypothetical protein